MKISGFTFLRNAHQLYYPVAESIQSILPLVDEFVVALGKGDAADTSLELLHSLQSPKIKIVFTEWDTATFQKGSIYAQQTDVAKSHCSGDWLFYLQGDEVVHENDLPEIKQACQQYFTDQSVEGFVFNYLHFFGNYEHFYANHCWYKREIRIIRNWPDIHSWRDAQSFRWMPDFDGENYFQMQGTRKLRCIALDARIFHYGWVRPPHVMQRKNLQAQQLYGSNFAASTAQIFDYGRLDYCQRFQQTHPAIMQERIKTLDWQQHLRFSGPVAINRAKLKHERTKYRIISWIEEKLLGGRTLGGFKNYTLLPRSH